MSVKSALAVGFAGMALWRLAEAAYGQAGSGAGHGQTVGVAGPRDLLRLRICRRRQFRVWQRWPGSGQQPLQGPDSAAHQSCRRPGVRAADRSRRGRGGPRHSGRRWAQDVPQAAAPGADLIVALYVVGVCGPAPDVGLPQRRYLRRRQPRCRNHGRPAPYFGVRFPCGTGRRPSPALQSRCTAASPTRPSTRRAAGLTGSFPRADWRCGLAGRMAGVHLIWLRHSP
jgi:hypothetical protein